MGDKLFQERIHERIDAAHEEAGHRGHVLDGLSGASHLGAGKVGFGHLPITRQPKEQRHVDADPFADELADRRQSFGRAGDLDEDVGTVEGSPQTAGLLDRAIGIAGQAGTDLQAHVAILAVGLVV